MLPPGHIAAGFLTSKALLYFVHPELSLAQQTHLLWWGMFFSFAPDLDMFYSFAREKAFEVRDPKKNHHRNFFSHTPLLWMLAGLAIYFFSGSEYFKIIGLLLWLCSWSHFVLDSIEYGIMWLWPFNTEKWALKDRGIDKTIEGENFFEYWLNFLKFYFTRWTFYVEIVLLISALFFIKL